MHVILLAPHFPANQLRFLEGLKRVGARVTGIVDARPEHLPSQVVDLLDDVEFVRSVTDEAAVERAVRAVQRRGPWVHRLEATVEAHVRVAANVRERTGIPGLPASVVELCRDKYAMKAFLIEQGFPCAEQRAVSTPAEARLAADELGLPVILKPRDGAGAAGTFKIRDAADLEAAITQSGFEHGASLTMEEFLTGHEGFYDTLTVGGEVLFEGVCHYFPNVLEAMRDRSVNPFIAVTNQVEGDAYVELRAFGRRVVTALGITTSATHMEWFFGPNGLKFSEIGARPPGVSLWDVYAACNDFDIYTEWARAVCWGDVHGTPSRKYAGAILAIRPDRDGRVQGYTGVEDVQRRYGEHIVTAHLPAEGTPTQPIEAGYRANAWLHLRHPDFDALKAMATDIGLRLRMFAS
jgi:formate-dependent phosphoribosylglycinamide formyltransferase (GAR transformylase)